MSPIQRLRFSRLHDYRLRIRDKQLNVHAVSAESANSLFVALR